MNEKETSKNQQHDKEDALKQDNESRNVKGAVNKDSTNANKLVKPPKEKRTFKIGSSIKQSAKTTADFSRKICNRCYGFLKDKGIFDKTKKSKTIIFSVLGLFVIILALFILVFSVHHQKTAPNPASNLKKINSIQTELSNVQNRVATTSHINKQEMQPLENKLQEISKKLKKISNNTGASQNDQIKNLQTTLQSNKIGLSQKIGALNKEIKRIKAKVFSTPTLSANVLPFKVISIDPWNGEPYAEVVQRNNSTMTAFMGLYQTVGGWKVIDISAPEQTVTFVNEQEQIVHVQIKQF